MARRKAGKKFLYSRDLCPLPPSNRYSKLTIEELFKQDPEYAVWMVSTHLAYRWAEDIRQKVNEYKRNLRAN